MADNKDNKINIQTCRTQFGKENIIEKNNNSSKSADSFIDWIISTKSNIKTFPINMRKFVEYAEYLKQKIILLPLVLRKRALYKKLINA